MKSIVIKIVDKNSPDLVEQARGELEGADFIIIYEEECDPVRVDATKHGNGVQPYNNAVVLIGEKSYPDDT